jgi:NitT/TauT family transport system substrate-binding protein
MNRVLDKAGLKETDVKMQNVQFDQLFAAFANGSLDVSWSIEPFTTTMIDQGVVVKLSDTFELFGPAQSTIVIFSPNMETQKQDAGKKFMVGYLRAVRDYIDAFDNNKDYDAIVAILAKNTTLKDPAVYKKITVPTFEPNGAILVDNIQANEDLYVARGDIKVPTPVTSIYDHSFIDYAVGVAGKRYEYVCGWFTKKASPRSINSASSFTKWSAAATGSECAAPKIYISSAPGMHC